MSKLSNKTLIITEDTIILPVELCKQDEFRHGLEQLVKKWGYELQWIAINEARLYQMVIGSNDV